MGKQTLLICGSMKPGPGKDSKSAARELLNIVKKAFDDHNYDQYKVLDLRDLKLPFFDGRDTKEYQNEHVDDLYHSMLVAEHIIISAPSYWKSVAGAVINAINIIGGPLYDFPEKKELLIGKKVSLIVVGAEFADAVHGASQLRNSFTSMGANVLRKEIMVGNLRNLSVKEQKNLVTDLYNLGKNIALKSGEYVV
ncbi:MAG TPA: NAD(P)H-dependent oxidoreductase [Bacillus sp. (in: firmicutes)]|uniref:NAD(P)H-dependent oxidoreductase n=1 Tax=Bacillus litorisediminis TaxID=2922713 RepID=UPI001FACD820|nr:NAD(P)H-dependent oxidoreductase [Bacillus litorisediminis]HWO75953.1 NAD(P)H-dependent oxidoreductase [Bacillus sp. (in: firmicutes)]